MSSKNKLPKLFVVLPLLLAALALAFHFLKSQRAGQSLTKITETHLSTETQRSVLSESKPAAETQTTVNISESLPGASLLVLGKKINLNQATLKDLVALPGIGEKLAQMILEHRHRKGPFKKIEDLMKVKGIKTKKFTRVKKYISVSSEEKL